MLKEMLGSLTPVELSHNLLRSTLKPGDIAVDGTVGNGNDLLFLLRLTGDKGKAFGFEVQGAGLVNTLNRLYQEKIPAKPTLFFAGHETLDKHLPTYLIGKINAFIFNLGYLPGSDKQLITRPGTTLEAFNKAVEWLAPGGVLVAVVYRGHPGGMEESQQILTWAQQLPPHQMESHLFQRLNLRDTTPYVLLIRKTAQASAQGANRG